MPGEVGEYQRRRVGGGRGDAYRGGFQRGTFESRSGDRRDYSGRDAIPPHHPRPPQRGKRSWDPDAHSEPRHDGGSSFDMDSDRQDGAPSAVSYKRARVGDAGDAAAGEAGAEREDDEAKAAARMKQIAFGKNTLGYDAYIAAVPKHQRRGYLEHPRTPDPYEKQSKRMFDGKVRAWRRLLHNWDPSGSGGGGADDLDGRQERQEEGDTNDGQVSARGREAAGGGTVQRPVEAAMLGATRSAASDHPAASVPVQPAAPSASSSADMDALLAANMDEMDDDELDAFLATHSSGAASKPMLSSAALDAGAESFDEEEDVL